MFFRGIFSADLIKCLVEKNVDWKIGAYRINNTIYLCSFDTELLRKEREIGKASPTRVRASNWGYKFEQFMLSGKLLVISYLLVSLIFRYNNYIYK